MSSRVLVVEDSPVIQRLIEMCLQPVGVAVEFCDNGMGGLESATNDPPAAMVLDIGLPGMGGWEVLESLRANDQTRHVPVLVLTAHGRAAVQREADDRGANAALSKPFNPHELRETVEGLLAG